MTECSGICHGFKYADLDQVENTFLATSFSKSSSLFSVQHTKHGSRDVAGRKGKRGLNAWAPGLLVGFRVDPLQ